MNKMNKLVLMGALAGMVCFSAGCMQTIEPGHVGIKVNKVGSDRGVSKENLVSGWVFYMPITTKIIEYPVFNQRVAWTASTTEGKAINEELSFQTKDSVPVTLDIAVNYELKAEKVPEFYTKFRRDDIQEFTHGYMRDQCRNVIANVGSEYTFDEVNGAKKEEFFMKINKTLAADLAPYGVIIAANGISSIGSLRPPEDLKKAIAMKVKAIQDSQRITNELQSSVAEAKKKVAEAEGAAAAMRAKSASITPQFMELKKLEIQEAAIDKWDGKLPDTILGGGNNMMFNIPTK